MADTTPGERSRQVPPLILVADDSRVVTELIRRWLQQIGARVVTAADGVTALEIGLDQPIDLAVVDQVMPGLIGAEIVQSWRAAGMDAPVIMISAVEDRRTKVEALDLGADLYLYKPISGNEFISEVRRLLETPRHPPTP